MKKSSKSSESLATDIRTERMERAKAEKSGDQWKLTDDLKEQQPASTKVEVLKCDKSGLQPVPIKRDEKLLETESDIKLGSLTVK